MSGRTPPAIRMEKLNLKRVQEVYEATLESGNEWFAEGMIPAPAMSLQELEQVIKVLIQSWENDDGYWFYIIEVSTDQLVGLAFLNHINRTHQLANLGYLVRNSRAGEGIATEAAKRVAQFGFETLGLQRLEIVVRPENTASLKVAQNVGAVREGRLRNRLLHHGSPWDGYMHSLIPTDVGLD